MDQVAVTKPVVLTLTPENLNLVLRGLELMPFGQVRQAYQDIEIQIITQIKGATDGHQSNQDPATEG